MLRWLWLAAASLRQTAAAAAAVIVVDAREVERREPVLTLSDEVVELVLETEHRAKHLQRRRRQCHVLARVVARIVLRQLVCAKITTRNIHVCTYMYEHTADSL